MRPLLQIMGSVMFATLIAGCVSENKGTGAGANGAGAPDCLTVNQTTTGWLGDADYQFHNKNFVCQGNPTSEEFFVVTSTFAAGLVSSTILSDMDDAQTLWDTAGTGLDLTNSECNVTCTLAADAYSVFTMTAANGPIAGTLGYALRHRNSSDIMSCDVTLYTNFRNGNAIAYSHTNTASPGNYPLKTAFMHELGHCIGMDHPKTGGAAGTVMEGATAGLAAPATLNMHDADAFAYLYP